MRARIGALAAAALLPACNLCEEQRDEMVGDRCTRSEDCPQTGELRVCVLDTCNDRPCVLCDSPSGPGGTRTQCYRITPLRSPP